MILLEYVVNYGETLQVKINLLVIQISSVQIQKQQIGSLLQ